MTKKQIEKKHKVIVLEKKYSIKTERKGWAYSVYSDFHNAHIVCETPSATLKELNEYLSHI